jgi:hypothetical protein
MQRKRGARGGRKNAEEQKREMRSLRWELERLGYKGILKKKKRARQKKEKKRHMLSTASMNSHDAH